MVVKMAKANQNEYEDYLQEIYLNISENLESPNINLDWLYDKIGAKNVLHLEETISNCLIANHKQFFYKGFQAAIHLLQEKKM